MDVFSVVISLLLLFLSVSSPYVNGNLVLDIQCSFVVLNMATCLSFVTIGSQVDKPDTLCCSGLKTVLDKKAECLCVGLKKSASMGIKVNITKAATLPTVCKLDAPPTTAACSCKIFSSSSPLLLSSNVNVIAVVFAVSSNPPASMTAPSPHSNHGFSLIPISGLSYAISSALVILLSRI